MNRLDIDSRDAALLYEAGFTLEDIGEFYGTSRQRIHQILPRHVSRRPPGIRASPRSGREQAERARIAIEVAQVLSDWSFKSVWLALFPGHAIPVSHRGRSKPLSLYPTKAVQIAALWNAGLSLSDISELTATPKGQIGPWLTRARRIGCAVNYRKAKNECRYSSRAASSGSGSSSSSGSPSSGFAVSPGSATSVPITRGVSPPSTGGTSRPCT